MEDYKMRGLLGRGASGSRMSVILKSPGNVAVGRALLAPTRDLKAGSTWKTACCTNLRRHARVEEGEEKGEECRRVLCVA